VEFAAQHGGDDGSRDYSGSSDADDELGVVLARNLQRERARKLAEKRPLHMQNSL
jgi:hypothetical protein